MNTGTKPFPVFVLFVSLVAFVLNAASVPPLPPIPGGVSTAPARKNSALVLSALQSNLLARLAACCPSNHPTDLSPTNIAHQIALCCGAPVIRPHTNVVWQASLPNEFPRSGEAPLIVSNALMSSTNAHGPFRTVEAMVPADGAMHTNNFLFTNGQKFFAVFPVFASTLYYGIYATNQKPMPLITQ